jgi:hypothetical protein
MTRKRLQKRRGKIPLDKIPADVIAALHKTMTREMIAALGTMVFDWVQLEPGRRFVFEHVLEEGIAFYFEVNGEKVDPSLGGAGDDPGGHLVTKAVVVQPALGVGSTVWIFDENRRVYPDGPDGRRSFGTRPIWREHWRPTMILSETRVSWCLEGRRKISKRGLAASTVRGVLTSEADLDAACYVHEHASKISDRVGRISGGRQAAGMLRQIAALVGYDDGRQP